jgi:hypothetical protein
MTASFRQFPRTANTLLAYNQGINPGNAFRRTDSDSDSENQCWVGSGHRAQHLRRVRMLTKQI